MIDTTAQMTEKTLQYVIFIFSICMGLITFAITVTFCIIIVRDGNNPLVAQAFNNLSNVAQNGIYAMAAVIVGKPLASGILQYLQGKGVQASGVTISTSTTQTQAGPGVTLNNTTSP